VLLKLVTPPLVAIPLPSPANPHVARAESAAFVNERSSSFAAADGGLSVVTADEAEVMFAGVRSQNSLTLPAKGSSPVPMQFTHVHIKILKSWCAIDPRRQFSMWTWERWLLIVFALGAITRWVLALVRVTRFQTLLSDIQPIDSRWQSRVRALAAHIGLRNCPAAYLVPGRVPPMIWAIGGRARLLVPSQLWSAAGEDERMTLIVHELAHLKRRDHWVRWLELLVAGIYWWNPIVWWVCSRMREAEEQCCDVGRLGNASASEDLRGRSA
jgi:beta-lactamase regulating signal transducer with metallopeptidase domain